MFPFITTTGLRVGFMLISLDTALPSNFDFGGTRSVTNNRYHLITLQLIEPNLEP